MLGAYAVNVVRVSLEYSLVFFQHPVTSILIYTIEPGITAGGGNTRLEAGGRTLLVCPPGAELRTPEKRRYPYFIRYYFNSDYV